MRTHKAEKATGLDKHQAPPNFQVNLAEDSSSILSSNEDKAEFALSSVGCVRSMCWVDNTNTNERQSRWLHPHQRLVVDLFVSRRGKTAGKGKMTVSISAADQWTSPHDSIMPAFANKIAHALRSAGVACRYKQESLQFMNSSGRKKNDPFQ